MRRKHFFYGTDATLAAAVETDPDLAALRAAVEGNAADAQAGSNHHEAPAVEVAPTATETTDPADEDLKSLIAVLTKRLDDLTTEVGLQEETIESLRSEVEQLRDFRTRVTEVVTATVEAAAEEAVNVRLQKSWAEPFEKLLKLVREQKEVSAQTDADTAEVRLHLPMLRKLAGVEALVARAEAAAAIVNTGIAKIAAGKPADKSATPASIFDRQ